MRKTLFCVLWFVLTSGVFVSNASLLAVIRAKKTLDIFPSLISPVTAPLPWPRGGAVQGISTIVEGEDARAVIVSEFLKRHSSPLQPADYFGRVIVDTADRYNVDYRLIPAIMMQESNLCKAIPPGSHNCLGFGIHERGTLKFDTYEDSIDRATRELKANYIDKGLTTPEEIMTKYTPGSNGSWADSVNQWIAEMEYNDRDKGKAEKGDADLTQYVQK